MALLIDPHCPPGQYLVEQTGETVLLLRISEGESANETLVPSEDWMFRLVETV
jgi:hypothetical protein